MCESPVANRGKGRFDGVVGPNVLPVFGREIKEGQQSLTVLAKAIHRLRVLGLPGAEEVIEGFLRAGPVLGVPNLTECVFGLGLGTLGQVVRTLAVLWTQHR